MSDLKATLAETLREALVSVHPFNGGDYPDWFGDWVDEAAPKAADVLLGLSDVAVTQLPEPNEEVATSEFENGSKWFGGGGDVVVYDDGEIHLFGAVWPTSDARDLATGLLAAVVLSEGETR